MDQFSSIFAGKFAFLITEKSKVSPANNFAFDTRSPKKPLAWVKKINRSKMNLEEHCFNLLFSVFQKIGEDNKNILR